MLINGSEIWADVSYFQAPVNDSYLDAGYDVLSIRSNDGTFQDPNFAENYAWARPHLDSGALKCLFVYYYWRPGTGASTQMELVNSLGGPHPRMVSMIDLESGGNVDVDQSGGLVGDYDRLVGWLGGNDKRVIGYGNQGDLRTMWQFPGHQIDVIVAGYGANPSSPNPALVKIGHQYTDGRDFGDGLPTSAPPFGTCDMNSADGMSVDELCAAVGLGPVVVPPPPVIVTPPPVVVGPPRLPALPTDDSIYVATVALAKQFTS